MMVIKAEKVVTFDESQDHKTSKVKEYFRSVVAIIGKDLRIELRSRELISVMLVFALLVIIIFNFTLEFEPRMRLTITPGILWVTFTFAGTLGLNRSLAIEKDRGCFDGLLLAPVDHSAIFIGKLLGNLIFMFLIESIILPVYSLFYNINLFDVGLIYVIFLGSIGYITVGTLLSSLAVQTRIRDILLPILLFPVVVPVLLASVKASSGFLGEMDGIIISPWIYILIAYDLIFLAVGFMFFDYIVED